MCGLNPFLLHTCFVNQTYKTDIAIQWGDRITQEFKQQSEREARLDLPIT